MEVFDVVIIGGGPAGSLAASKISQSGFKVLLLEASSLAKRKICGESLCPKGEELLKKEFGEIYHKLNLRFINGISIVSPSGAVVASPFPFNEKENIQSVGLVLNRGTFDLLCFENARGNGVTALLQKRVTEIRKIQRNFRDANSEGDLWEIATAEGDKFLAKFLIGADGKKSKVAKCLDLTCQDSLHSSKRVALHTHLTTQEETKEFCEMHLFSDGSYIGINPTEHHEINFSLICDIDKMQSLGGPRLAIQNYMKQSKILSDYLGKSFSTESENNREMRSHVKIESVYPITHQVKKITGKGYALIGDAAGFLDPLTGEGMYNAIWMANELSNTLIHSHKKKEHLQNFTAKKYQKGKMKFFRGKNRLNVFFLQLIKYPRLIEGVARFLLAKKGRDQIFIGILGNIYTPFEGIKLLILSLFKTKDHH